MKKHICKYCTNQMACKECDDNWHDHFIPSDEVKKYFHRTYNGVMGIRGYTYDFDTTSESLVPTHSILIGTTHYCPYCGEQMYPIQTKAANSFPITGYCCICEGARAELEYEAKKKELETEYNQKIIELQGMYSDKLSFLTGKLLKIKQMNEKPIFDEINHFCTLNGETYKSIEQLIR